MTKWIDEKALMDEIRLTEKINGDDLSYFKRILKDVPKEKNVYPSWTPCSKRIPKAGENVLISMDDENVTVGRIVKIGKTKMWQIDIGEYPIDEFAAWMPTPKPYEVEK